jgi:hypothetical protein
VSHLSTVISEWKALSRGEVVFLALIALGVLVLAVSGWGGVAGGLVGALVAGLLAGVVVALARRRRTE